MCKTLWRHSPEGIAPSNPPHFCLLGKNGGFEGVIPLGQGPTSTLQIKGPSREVTYTQSLQPHSNNKSNTNIQKQGKYNNPCLGPPLLSFLGPRTMGPGARGQSQEAKAQRPKPRGQSQEAKAKRPKPTKGPKGQGAQGPRGPRPRGQGPGPRGPRY